MTYSKDTWIWCDECGTNWHGCEGTASEAREKMKEDGWVNRGTEDYCPRCK